MFGYVYVGLYGRRIVNVIVGNVFESVWLFGLLMGVGYKLWKC